MFVITKEPVLVGYLVADERSRQVAVNIGRRRGTRLSTRV